MDAQLRPVDTGLCDDMHLLNARPPRELGHQPLDALIRNIVDSGQYQRNLQLQFLGHDLIVLNVIGKPTEASVIRSLPSPSTTRTLL